MAQRWFYSIFFIFMILVSVSCQTKKGSSVDKDSDLKDEKSKFSYAIGLDIASNLEKFKKELDYEIVFEAVLDSLTSDKVRMDPKQAREIKSKVFQELRKKEMALKSKQAKENKEIGEAFLKENRKNKGIKVTESGLQYKVLKKGKGKSPKGSDKVKVHYEGKHLNGDVFDSSKKRNKPSSFPVNRVIKGWQEALKLMKEGSKWRIFVPAELAYGKRGAKGEIEPNETLIFDIELLEVNNAPDKNIRKTKRSVNKSLKKEQRGKPEKKSEEAKK